MQTRHVNRNLFAVTGVLVLAFLVGEVNLADKNAVTVEPPVQRPISDFLQAQGTTADSVAPIPDYIGWVTFEGTGASVDYAGLANAWLVAHGHGSLGTTFEGTVDERPLPDGRAEVSVTLFTHNALTWAVRCARPGCAFAGDALLFGRRPQDVLAGAEPALGDSQLKVVFDNEAPGAPLPDLVANHFCFVPNPVCEFVYISIEANATGALRGAFGVADGTPGQLTLRENRGLFRGPAGDAPAYGYPAELLELRTMGH